MAGDSLGRLGRLVVEPARVEVDPPLLPHGDVARERDHGVGQRDLAAAARLVLFVGVIVGRIAVADAVGEVLELLAIAARRIGRGQAAQRRRRGRAGRARAGLQGRLLALGFQRDAGASATTAGLPASLNSRISFSWLTIIVPFEPMTCSP